MSSEYTWIMSGMDWDEPGRIRSWRELISYIDQIGFLPLFKNEIRAFSVEEHVSSLFWLTGDPDQDPWVWRELIAADHQVAYGKFFDKKAGFNKISLKRDEIDFDNLGPEIVPKDQERKRIRRRRWSNKYGN